MTRQGAHDPRHHDPARGRRPHLRQDDAWIAALFSRLWVGRVATVWMGEDGEPFPFITTLAYAYRPERHDLVYHTNIVGRLWANTAQGHAATLEVAEVGARLPSNTPLELGVQYRSAVAYGHARRLDDPAEAEEALAALCAHTFPHLRLGHEMRPISPGDLARTSVFSLQIGRWGGKENWKDAADQDTDWPDLPPGLAGPYGGEA